MRYIFLIQILFISSFANLNNINFFEADFEQVIIDDKDKKLIYSGHVMVAKPQSAVWMYKTPVKKRIYLKSGDIVIVEPEIEQVIIKSIDNEFDFLHMIQNAKKTQKNQYVTRYKESTFHIRMENQKIKSIAYKDEFENSVILSFTNQIQNVKIEEKKFIPIIPQGYDVIED